MNKTNEGEWVILIGIPLIMLVFYLVSSGFILFQLTLGTMYLIFLLRLNDELNKQLKKTRR